MSIEATLELLADPDAQDRLRAADADIAAVRCSMSEQSEISLSATITSSHGEPLGRRGPDRSAAPAEALPEAVAAACIEFGFGPLAQDPRRVGARLRKPFEGQWRARRGEYRVGYRIDNETGTVYVLDIDHRRDAYRS